MRTGQVHQDQMLLSDQARQHRVYSTNNSPATSNGSTLHHSSPTPPSAHAVDAAAHCTASHRAYVASDEHEHNEIQKARSVNSRPDNCAQKIQQTGKEKGDPVKSQSKRHKDRRQFVVEKLKFKQDHRASLPLALSRFTGYRPPSDEPPYEPLPFAPFTWLHKIPLKYEVWLFGFVGAFGSILSIEAIMATQTAFRDDYHAPIIVTSFGASAVLLFGVIESPLAQPRNFVLGQFISALVGTCITRLFVFNHNYRGYLDNAAFHGNTFVNGGLSMAFSLLAQDMVGALHPPAGATGLNAAVEPGVAYLSWRYLPVVLASSMVMLGWALLVNNLGRRRYPIYWWEPESRMVVSTIRGAPDEEEEQLKELEEGKLRQAEDGGRTSEGLLYERMEGEGGTQANIDQARRDSGQQEPEAVLREPKWKDMTAGDRERAQG